LFGIFGTLYILSSEYPVYACGKNIACLDLKPKYLVFGQKLTYTFKRTVSGCLPIPNAAIIGVFSGSVKGRMQDLME